MNIILVLSSITYALKAQELLKKEGIYASLTRSPAVKSVRGCGYGIMVPAHCEGRARHIMQTAGIKILGSVTE